MNLNVNSCSKKMKTFRKIIKYTEKGYNPNMHFEVNIEKKIMNKIKGSIYYDKIDISTFENTFKVDDINSKLIALVFYGISKNVDLIFKYQKSFTIDAMGNIQSAVNYGIETKLNF